MRKALLAAGAALALAAGPAMAQQKSDQDRLRLDLQRPDRRDRQRHAQFVRARARPHGPQDGRLAGRGDLRGRRLEAGGRQAEDAEADRSPTMSTSSSATSGRTCCWRRSSRPSTPRPSSSAPMPARRRVAGELCSPYFFSTSWQNDQTPHAMGLYMNQKGVKSRVPDRPELRRRQGHAGGRRLHLQGQGGWAGTHHLAVAARLLRRTRQGQGRQSGRHLRVLSGQGGRAVSQSIRPGRHEG